MPMLAYAAAGLLIAVVITAVARRQPAAGAALTAVGAVALLVAASALTRRVYGGDPFALMQLWCWSLFLQLPALLLGWGWALRRARPRLAAGAGLGAVVLIVIGVDAFFVEPRWLETKRVVVSSAKVDRPVRIVVLADIQTDRVGAYEAEALRRAMAEDPDLVLFPGDYVQVETPADYAEQGARFRELILAAGLERAELGAFAVQGNVEWPEWVEVLFAGTPVRASRGTRVHDLGPVTVTALSFDAGFDTEGRVPAAADGDFHIAFAHGPDFALGDVRADLLVAGHTHGGQVQLPFYGPPITYSAVPRAWADDTTALPGGRTLVVSRGVGLERRWAPRLRFWCRPQIVVVDVVPAAP